MHDLKPERADLAPPLPAVMMVAPILLLVSVLATAGLSTWYTIEKKQAQQEELDDRSLQASLSDDSKKITEDTKEIEEQHNKAKDVQRWVASTHSLMDVVVAVLTSVKPGNNLSSLRLVRSPENMEHVEIRLLINNGGQGQKDDVVQSLMAGGYQPYKEESSSTDRTNQYGDVTYTATLVKNVDAGAEQP